MTYKQLMEFLRTHPALRTRYDPETDSFADCERCNEYFYLKEQAKKIRDNDLRRDFDNYEDIKNFLQ